jgi:hypothetical protein
MVKISILISAFHPAILRAIPESVCVETLLATVNNVLETAQTSGDESGDIKGKVGKDVITLSVSGKLKGIKLPKDSAEALLARVHWALTATREVYCRVETVTLPDSVSKWVTSKAFDKEEIAKAELEAAKVEFAKKALDTLKA